MLSTWIPGKVRRGKYQDLLCPETIRHIMWFKPSPMLSPILLLMKYMVYTYAYTHIQMFLFVMKYIYIYTIYITYIFEIYVFHIYIYIYDLFSFSCIYWNTYTHTNTAFLSSSILFLFFHRILMNSTHFLWIHWLYMF